MKETSRKCMTVMWPSFLAAGVLELVVFGLVSPEDFKWGDAQLGIGAVGVYTVAFFLFWAIAGLSSYLTTTLSRTCEDLNGEAHGG